MPNSIVDIKNMGDALRNTGYKNIESAAAEIVDNSVEANAKNVFMIISESINPISGRKVVTEIGFLDNGEGMDTEILGKCLGIGATTRQARKGMGRFGVGLPQASLHACPNVEVYSWQGGINNCYKVYLDINKVKDGVQTEIEDPEAINLPEKYAKYVNYHTLTASYDFSQSGTLVIWKNCDRVIPRTRGPLTEHLEFALGRKFRHFIDKEICAIKIICDENQENAVDVLPNDPLFLMEKNYAMCKRDDVKTVYKYGQTNDLEPVFELYSVNGVGNGEVDIPVKYIDKDEQVASSIVKARFSIVKNLFYDETAFPNGQDPGRYTFGSKYAKPMTGISVVRAGREIDFGEFDFYEDINEPQHRWWGCEIIFEPELDEAFGVANNKQYVDLKRIIESDIDYEEAVQPMWNQLYDTIATTIKSMYNKNKETRKNTRSADDIARPSTNIINTVETEDEFDDEIEEIKNPLENVSAEEIIQIGKEELENLGYENVTDEQASNFFNNQVVFDYADKGERSPAFDYKVVFTTTVITINTSHKFYTFFLSKLYNSPDAQITFELLLASIFQSIRKTNAYQEEQNDKLITLWYNKLNNYITEQLNPRK